MNKKVLILSSSPRRGGNSDLLCDQFKSGAQESGHQAEKINLKDKKVNYCTGCGTCFNREKPCPQKDDMAAILDKMIAADVIVMATPVYFYTMNSVATRLLLLALCIVCLGLVVRYFTLMRFLHEELATAIESQQLTLSSYIAHNINDNAINKQVTLNRIASSLPPSLLRKPTQLRYWLEQQNKDQTSRAEDFLVVDLAGQPIAAFPATTKWKRLTPDIRALIQAKLSGHLGAGRLLMQGGTQLQQFRLKRCRVRLCQQRIQKARIVF